METTPVPTTKTDQKNSIKNLEKFAVEKKLISLTRASKLQKLINTTFFKITISTVLFSSLFAVAFVISYLNKKQVSVPISGPDIIPTAGIKLPISVPTTTTENPSISPNTTITKTPLNTSCAIAGCNDELCVEDNQKEKIASICVYKDEYSCYKTAKCEKQADGKCGWTQSNELKTCLSQYQ